MKAIGKIITESSPVVTQAEPEFFCHTTDKRDQSGSTLPQRTNRFLGNYSRDVDEGAAALPCSTTAGTLLSADGIKAELTDTCSATGVLFNFA